MLEHLIATALLASRFVFASETQFSVNDDLFAVPPYEVIFSESFIPESTALKKYRSKSADRYVDHLVEKGDPIPSEGTWYPAKHDEDEDEEYEIMTAHGRDFFCTIPLIQPTQRNETEEKVSEADQRKEVARAVDRGRELLSGMEGHQCLFYSTGWWTYSFCYNSQVRQFHALSPGQTGGRVWPPQEDPTTPSFVLGKFDQKNTKSPSSPNEQSQRTDLAQLQTKAETSYLVQRLDGGTPCDLTGKNRNVEIQFHCNPQLTDRIGWIKETATCSYLMVVYTPRLCNDVAFQPPKESRANPITCQEILKQEEIPEWEARKKAEANRKMIGQGKQEQLLKVGDIEIGAMKYLGKDGKKLERGRIVMTPDEKAATIVMQKDGQISSVAEAELRKLDLDPEDIEVFKKELQKLAGNKDWKIERIDDMNGQIQLRGVVETDDDKKQPASKKVNKAKASEDEDEASDDTGSQEEYKEDL